MNKLTVGLALVLAVAVSGCKAKEPERITVQHILIAFQGTIPDSPISRTREEAEALAKSIYERALKGEDFDALVKEYTNDEHPGIYHVANIGITPDAAKPEYARDKLVKAFGDVGFSLKVNGIGMAVYDPASSKYGWHIIKRLE